MNDYEINKNAKLEDIKDIANKLDISDIYQYGNHMAKFDAIDNDKKGKLILVTATNPTPYGEGKTTLAIGIHDALCKHGIKSAIALREPSMGPVFGIKGGATGGGVTQVAPMNEINLHFTGDFHAITSANNLISAVIDNHIFGGNELDIQEVYFQRCLDVNDRALRNVEVSGRKERFTITAASEIMAIFTLAKNLDDLRDKIDNILVGKNSKGELIYLKELNCTGSVLALLNQAMKPNLVQTLENNPAIIHGGPFANIAHGCNSIIATKTAMSLADVTITEAGFGSDMGALKFLDIKCGLNDIYPDLIIVNATIRSMKYHGNGELKEGLSNLEFHIKNMKKFNDNVLVVLNKFNDDTEEEINIVKEFVNSLDTEMLLSEMYSKGSKDTDELVEKIMEYINKENTKTCNIYDINEPIVDKIDKYCKNIFGASEVIYKDNLKEELSNLDEKFQHYKICISKTPASISDNAKILGYPKDFAMTVTDYKINNGAGFVTILMGNVITMPGLSKTSNYLNIDVVDNEIIGIF